MISFVQVNNPLAFGYYINKYPLHGIVLLLNYYLFHKQVFPNFRSYFYSVSYFPRLLLRKPMRIVYYLVRTKNPRWQASACSRADISKVFNAVTLFVARLLHFILHPIYCLLSILCKLVICSGKKINMETGFTIHNKQRDVILGHGSVQPDTWSRDTTGNHPHRSHVSAPKLYPFVIRCAKLHH